MNPHKTLGQEIDAALAKLKPGRLNAIAFVFWLIAGIVLELISPTKRPTFYDGL